MKKAYIIFLTVLLQSCIVTNLQQVNNDFSYIKILSDKSSSYIYKTKIDLYENYFSGLIIIKPKAESHRIVFINEIGMKFFDIELSADSYKLHQIFEPMNKKMFINLLVSDFKSILMYNLNSESKYFRDNESDSDVIKPIRRKELYFFNKDTHLPHKAFRYSTVRKNTFFTFREYEGNIPEKISIKHKNIKFVMELNFVKKTS